MNLKRLLNIAQEADKNGDYVTADKVTNLLKTAQGQYSVYPNQAAYERTPQQSQQMLQAQQQPQEKQLFDQLFQRIQNAHKIMGPNRQREILDIQSQIDNNSIQYPSLRKLQSYLSMVKMNAKNTNYQIQNYEQQKRLEQIEKVKSIMGLPSTYQQSPVSTYYAPMAAGATYFTPGVVNAPPPQMTDEQKAFAKLRGTGIYQSLSKSNGVMDQRLQAIENAENKARQSRIYYGPAAGQANPNASINPNLYGTGYASMAMNPQLQPQPPYNPQQQLQQQPQQQPQQQQYPYNQQPNQIR